MSCLYVVVLALAWQLAENCGVEDLCSRLTGWLCQSVWAPEYRNAAVGRLVSTELLLLKYASSVQRAAPSEAAVTV